MGNVVHVGLTKYDVLGLATLTMIALCFDMIEKRHGADKIPDFAQLLEGNEDPKVLRLFTEGKTDSVFQFASAGMKKSLKEVKADCIEDLIAINALFRPGPLQFIPQYAEGKKNPASVWNLVVKWQVSTITMLISFARLCLKRCQLSSWRFVTSLRRVH
jgi:DNA polymerase-3 subunit alpha